MHDTSNQSDPPVAPDRFTASVERCSGKFAIGRITLTNLQALQERYGADGNVLIGEVFRERIAQMLRTDDEMIVIADDSVCVVIDDLIDSNHLHLAGLKISRLFDVPHEAAGQAIEMSVRSGLVYGGRRTRLSKPPGELYQLAEDACRTAVIADKPFEIVIAANDQPQDNDWQMNQRVQAAMENHQIGFDYQPKIELHTGRLAGGEALLRWRDNGRILPPDEYLAALDNDVLWQLTIYGYRRVLREILDHEIGVPVSFNIDPSSLAQRDFVDFMCRETRLWGVPHEQITFEITDSNELFDLARSKAQLESISNRGFRISLDDFGAGHSNMQRFRELPVDEIKLDRSLCSNVLLDDDARRVARSVIKLATALELPVVAEGVEDAATMEVFKGMACRFGQGFYLGAPDSIEAFAAHQRTQL